MHDPTRDSDDPAPGHDPDRTPSSDARDAILPASLGALIDALRAEGEVVLAMTAPWSEAVHEVFDRFDEVVSSLHLDDELHHQIGEAAGIADLYDLLDAVSTATTEIL